jgi:NADH:ubiquinone oxidoreductase subunit 3 (subunit A)
MNTLLVVASLEAWPDIMYQALDVTGPDLGPTKENTLVSMIYFVIFILIGSFFFLNFFVGVLFLKFDNAQKEEQKGFSKDDLNWQDIQKLIIKAQPQYESTNVPSSTWRQYFHELVCS